MNNKRKDNKIINRIGFYRRRMRLSQRRVAVLLDHRDSTTLSSYESGTVMPPLLMAFRLAIILRIPAEFLFPDLYNSLREEIRSEEERMPPVRRRRQSHPLQTPT